MAQEPADNNGCGPWVSGLFFAETKLPLTERWRGDLGKENGSAEKVFITLITIPMARGGKPSLTWPTCC